MIAFDFLTLLALLTIGVAAGFAAGLLGIGGGLIIVPALAALMASTSPQYAMHIAIATSLATIVFTGASSVWAHHRHGAVRWSLVMWFTPGLLLGSWLGGVLASALAGATLARVFGVFCLLSGWQMWRGRSESSRPHPTARWLLTTAGLIIGKISALVGIGGGSLTVPFLIWRGERPANAVATAAAGGVPIALAGTASFIVAGQAVSLPAGSLGYVYLPALLGIVATSVIAAPVGARLAQRLPAKRLKQVFAVFLVVLGLLLLGRSF